MTASSRRPRIPARLMARVDGLASAAGVDPADIQDLALTAALPASTAAEEREATASVELLRRLADGETTSLQSVMSEIPANAVAVLRMGPKRGAIAASAGPNEDDLTTPIEDLPLEDIGNGYLRRCIGMSLSDSAGEVWAAAAGYWRMKPLPYLAPSRYGLIQFVFKVHEWDRASKNRIWARSGSLIDLDGGKLRRMEPVADRSGDYRPGRSARASSEDLRIAELLTRVPLRLGKRATNPVIPL